MKLMASPQMDIIILDVLTTDKEVKEFYFPKHHIHYWYPFNLNFMYKYSNSKEFLYLVKEKNYDGPNYYNVDILKRTKRLVEKSGVMFNPEVYKRNFHIIEIASRLGIPTIDGSYTFDDVLDGFEILADCIEAVKKQAQQRLSKDGDDFIQFLPTEDFDEEVYSKMTEEESEALIEMGEIYVMLTVMRKLTEGR
jgi:hypothetical protein